MEEKLNAHAEAQSRTSLEVRLPDMFPPFFRFPDIGFSQQSEILGDGSSDTDNRGGSRGGAFEIKNEEKMNDTMEKGLQKADNTKLSGDAIGVTRRHRKR